MKTYIEILESNTNIQKSFELKKGITWRDMKMIKGKYIFMNLKNGKYLYKHENSNNKYPTTAIFDETELNQFLGNKNYFK